MSNSKLPRLNIGSDEFIAGKVKGSIKFAKGSLKNESILLEIGSWSSWIIIFAVDLNIFNSCYNQQSLLQSNSQITLQTQISILNKYGCSIVHTLFLSKSSM